MFVGLDNYRRMLQDKLFWQSLKVTASTRSPRCRSSIVLGFAVALLMNQKVGLLGFFRTIYYLPNLVPAWPRPSSGSGSSTPSSACSTPLWRCIGIEGPRGWRTASGRCRPLIIMSLWGVGGGMLIYLAGLQGIPTDLYEAAEIDGAGPGAEFRHVTCR